MLPAPGEEQHSVREPFGESHIVRHDNARKSKLLLESLDQLPSRRAMIGSTIVVGSS